MDRLWPQWWSFNRAGHAIAAMKFLSCLLYLNLDDNPFFSARSGKTGDSLPLIVTTGSLFYGEAWLSENSTFLARTLQVGYLEQKVLEASKGLHELHECSGVMKRIERDVQRNRDILQVRLEQLPELLADTNWDHWPVI
jgi:hypothetical protein